MPAVTASGLQNNRKSKHSVRTNISSTHKCMKETNSSPFVFIRDASRQDRVVWLMDVTNKHCSLSEPPTVTVKAIITVTQNKVTLTCLTEVSHPYKGGVTRLSIRPQTR